jgi:osmotically-inducible protein OsmY
LLPYLHGCVAAAGAGAAAAASTAYDRRTTGTQVDDELIEWKVYAALNKNTALWEASHINVTSYNNIVLLTGESPDQSMRAAAQETARGVAKVRLVHNELRIAAPSSMLTRSSDSVITGKVKTALLSAKNVNAARIKVVTENGVVYLMGLVSRSEADSATEITRRTGGVQKVVRLFEYLKA